MNPIAQRWFWWGCLFEAGLGAVALALGTLVGTDWVSLWRGGPVEQAGVGLAVALLLMPLPWTVWHRPWPLFKQVRAVLEGPLGEMLSDWSVGQKLVIALLAGLAEESLFRGVLQASLTVWLGPLPALLVASVLFGLCHALNRAYALLATGMGLVLGLEFYWTGNLIAPAVTHAAYDFFALLYLTRLLRRAEP